MADIANATVKQAKNRQEISKLATQLRAIPENLAGVKEVDVLNEGQKSDQASKVIVHLRQLHGHNNTDLSNYPKELVQAANKYLPQGQKQQSQLLEIFNYKVGIRQVYLENMTNNTLAQHEEYFDILKGKNGQMLEVILQHTKAKTAKELSEYLEKNKNSNDPVVQLLQKQAERTWLPLLRIKESIQSDFVLNAAFAGKVQILPVEDAELHEKTLALVRKNPLITFGDGGNAELTKLQNQRDENYVSLISKNNKAVSLLVLGAGHSLEEEVRAYNSKSPNSPIRLIEVLPKAAEEYLKISEKIASGK